MQGNQNLQSMGQAHNPQSSSNLRQRIQLSSDSSGIDESPLSSLYNPLIAFPPHLESDYDYDPPLFSAKPTATGITKLLRYVVRGQQNEAEAMLEQDPHLARTKGNITDYSYRAFRDIFPLQYPMWALDYHLRDPLIFQIKNRHI